MFKKNCFIIILFCLTKCRTYAQPVVNATNKKQDFTKIIAFSPLQLCEEGYGFSLGYERVIINEGYATLVFPISYATSNTRTTDYGEQIRASMLYLSPGIKFYPTTCYHSPVKYAVGISLVAGSGNHVSYGHHTAGIFGPEDRYYFLEKKTIAGLLLTNSLNIIYEKHFYASLDFNLGRSFYYKRGGHYDTDDLMLQLGFKLGYCF